MGADGGTLAKRSELVSQKKEALTSKEFERGQHRHFWTTCGFTGRPLRDPVVSDWRGRLFDKEAILEYLLHEPFPEAQKSAISSEIKSLKDVVELQRDLVNGRWVCPLTSKDLADEGNSTTFAYIPECGHVGTLVALTVTSECPMCSAPFAGPVVLDPGPDALAKNKARMEALAEAGLTHSLKAAKKPRAKTATKATKARATTKTSVSAPNEASRIKQVWAGVSK